jgi:hypothetical protein
MTFFEPQGIRPHDARARTTAVISIGLFMEGKFMEWNEALKDRQRACERPSSAGSLVSVGEVNREANTPSGIGDVQDPA